MLFLSKSLAASVRRTSWEASLRDILATSSRTHTQGRAISNHSIIINHPGLDETYAFWSQALSELITVWGVFTFPPNITSGIISEHFRACICCSSALSLQSSSLSLFSGWDHFLFWSAAPLPSCFFQTVLTLLLTTKSPYWVQNVVRQSSIA